VPEPKPKDEVKEPEKTIANMDSLKNAVVDTKDQKGQKTDNANFVPPPVTDPNGTGKGPAVINEPPPPPPPKKEDEPKKDEEPDPNKFVPVQKRPEAVNLGDVRKAIGYPPIAKDGGIEGQVLLNILVDEQGNYKKHLVKQSAHPILLKEVEKHVSELRFTPAVQGGKAITFWVVVPFKFELRGN
jgi:TonB family protein